MFNPPKNPAFAVVIILVLSSNALLSAEPTSFRSECTLVKALPDRVYHLRAETDATFIDGHQAEVYTRSNGTAQFIGNVRILASSGNFIAVRSNDTNFGANTNILLYDRQGEDNARVAAAENARVEAARVEQQRKEALKQLALKKAEQERQQAIRERMAAEAAIRAEQSLVEEVNDINTRRQHLFGSRALVLTVPEWKAKSASARREDLASLGQWEALRGMSEARHKRHQEFYERARGPLVVVGATVATAAVIDRATDGQIISKALKQAMNSPPSKSAPEAHPKTAPKASTPVDSTMAPKQGRFQVDVYLQYGDGSRPGSWEWAYDFAPRSILGTEIPPTIIKTDGNSHFRLFVSEGKLGIYKYSSLVTKGQAIYSGDITKDIRLDLTIR